MLHIGRQSNFFSFVSKKLLKMSNLERILSNNKVAEELLDSLKSELSAINRELIARKKQELSRQKKQLLTQIESAKSELIQLECRNGKLQIPIPTGGATQTDPISKQTASSEVQQPSQPDDDSKSSAKPQKEKKPKKEKPAASTDSSKTAVVAEAPIDVGRLDFRVGKIVDVSRHPDADSLYLEKIDCGEPQPRTVVSGLVKFVPIEEMRDRMVVVLCNLKPAKMRGITSEAMVMCASTPEKVEVLAPPAGSIPGDFVHCAGYERRPDAQLNPKKKVFETCAPDLLTNGELVACYKGVPLHVPGKGNVIAQSLKNVQVK